MLPQLCVRQNGSGDGWLTTPQVNLARTENISILATGRRNGYSSTLAGLQNGLAIDLSLLNSVEINQTAKTLTVGPGVSIDDILDPLESKQFMMRKAADSNIHPA